MSRANLRVNLIVEGQSEEDFVNRLLRPALASQGIFVCARQVYTRHNKHGRTYKGGATSYGKARKDILNWLTQDTEAYVSTLFDLYALPNDFPSFAKAQKQTDPYQQVLELEKALFQDIHENFKGNPQRFIPFILLHEFEGLLFSDPEILLEGLTLEHEISGLQQALSEILEMFGGNPELINDSPQTAPSKRLIQLCPGYNKTLFGISIAEDIGLPAIRAKCPHFHAWVSQIEMLAEQE